MLIHFAHLFRLSRSSSMGNAPSIPPPAPAPAPTVYNVYNQPVDESNNMPLVPNQLPWPGQQRLLSTERVASSIPKGGGGQWVFPSPQMFFNALQRKGKGGDVTEEDMDSVILTHNTMNELTWRQVLLWERLQKADGGGASEPALVRFLGRPDDLSPRARFRSLLGGARWLSGGGESPLTPPRPRTLRPPRLVR